MRAGQSWPVVSDTLPVQADCGHLYIASGKSIMELRNDASGNPTATNRVVAAQSGTNGPSGSWAANLAMGPDPSGTNSPAFISSTYSGSPQPLYKVAAGTSSVTTDIYNGQTRTSFNPASNPGYVWGGFGMDPTKPVLYGAGNLYSGASKLIFREDLTTGVGTSQNPQGVAGDTVWQYGTFVPDIFVDADGNIYTAVSYSGLYVYQIDMSGPTWTARRVVQVQGPAGAAGTYNYGMAWLNGSIYFGQYDGTIFKVDPKTGASSNIGTYSGNTTGTTKPNTGGDYVLTDLASCQTSPNLLRQLTVSKTADKTTVLPGDTLTYTVTVKNTGTVDYPGASFTDDLTGVLTGATYNGDATASVGTVGYTSPTISWTGDLAVGRSATVTYSVQVTDPGSGTARQLRNAVTSKDSNCPAGSTDPACSTDTPVGGLSVRKTSDVARAKPGDTVTYTITVTNTGATDLPGASFDDDLTQVLDDATYNNDARAGTGTVGYRSPKLSWSGALAVGRSTTVTYSVKVNTPPNGDKRLVNAVVAPGSNCRAGSTDPACTSTVVITGLKVTKTADTAEARPGQKVTYTVTVQNTGGATETGATFTDNVSGVIDDATYNRDAAATAGTVAYREPLISWTGDVPAGATVTVTYSFTVDSPPRGDLRLANAVVSPDSNCPAGSTDPACSTVVPVKALRVHKSADKGSYGPGETATYTILIENPGTVDYPGATMTDDLTRVLDDADFVSATATSGTAALDGTNVVWNGDVPKGGTVTVTVVVRIKTDVTAGDGRLANAVVVPDSNCPAGSTDPACSTVVPVRRLEVTKTSAPAQVGVGGTVTYTLTVRNTGTAAYPGATVTDDLTKVLTGASYDGDAAADRGSVSFLEPRLTWTGDLPAGATARITYSVTVKSPLSGDGRLVNAVTAPDSNCPAGSTDPACSTTVLIKHLTVRKTADRTELRPGDKVTYTVRITNDGQVDDPGASFRDDLTKVLDDAVYGNDATATTGTVNYTAPTLSWTGNLPVGASATVLYSVTVNNPYTGDKHLDNLVVAPDSNCATGSTDPACGTHIPARNVKVVKTSSPAVAKPGDRVDYTVTVTNQGGDPVTGATFSDDLSQVLDDATYGNDATTTTGTVNYTAPTLTWTGDLAVGGTATVRYSVTVNNPATGDKKLVNVVTSPDGSCPPGSTDPDCVNTVRIRSLHLAKTASPAVTKPGDTVTYTVTVTNDGQTDITGATFSDDLTKVVDDARYNQDATATSGTAGYTAPVLTWTGDLAVGASARVTYSVTVNNPLTGDGRLTNAVTSPDGNCQAGSTDPACGTTVPVRHLTLVKSASPAVARPGDTVTYTVTVTNDGQTDITGATFSDDLTKVLDGAVYNKDAAATAGTVGYTAPTLTWTGDLAIGASARITYSVTVDNPVTGSGTLVNAVTAPDSNCPPDSTDPACDSTVPVRSLKIVKSADPAVAKPGDKVTYTVTVTNDGRTDITGATFSDDLTKVLDGAAYDNDAAATTGTVGYTAPTLTWTGDLAIGATARITYSVTVNNPVTGSGTLVNAVTSPDGNCRPGSTDPACGTTVPVRSLRIVKSASPAVATAGGQVTYTVTVTNDGQADIPNAGFTDDLTRVLTGADYRDDATADTGSVTYTAPRLSWTGALQPGRSATVRYSVTVHNPPGGDGKLVNAVTSEDGNCRPGSTDPACGTVVPVKHLTVAKTADHTSVKPGEKVTYTVTVTNTGGTDYPGATFTDDLTKVLDGAAYGNDATATAGTVGYTAPKLTWTGDLAIGATARITYSVTVNNPLTGSGKLVNAVTAPDSNCPDGSTDPACTNTVPARNIRITKTAAPTVARPGEKVTYTVTVANLADESAAGVSFSDDLTKVLDKAAYDQDAAATSGTVDYTAPVLRWTGDLPGRATATVTYSVTVNSPVTGDGKLANAVTSPDGSCPPGSTDPACGTVVPVRYLTVAKTTDVTEVKPGGTVHYALTVRNDGSVAYPGASAADDLTGVLGAADYNGDAAASTGSVALDGSTLRWSGDLAPGTAATITYSVTVKSPVPAGQSLKNAVTAPDSNCPPDSTDPACSRETPLKKLEVVKQADRTTVRPGEKVTYTVTVTNTGGTDYTDASATDDLTGVLGTAQYNGDATATTGTLAYTAPRLSWQGSLPAGARVVISYTVTVNTPATGSLDNTVTAPDSNCPVPMAGGRRAGGLDPRCSTHLNGRHLTLVKKADRQQAGAGDTVTYTVTVTNDGPGDLTDAAFTDDLGQVLTGADYNGDATAGTGTVSYHRPVLSWTGALAAGASTTVRYSVTSNGTAQLRNTVTSPDSNCPPDSTDPACTSTVTPEPPGPSPKPSPSPSPGPGPLPVTGNGAPVGPLLGLAGLLAAVGAGLWLTARRRRTMR
ncbi:hypothetical protein AB0O91_07285 [Kitasatospora sp. NPDC089797]|uniref:DUF7927 domain-containing protein n=1 Tax=Kitasatospora sp. NPDC089797 TaxID=3155298 RepID=UPI00341EA82B